MKSWTPEHRAAFRAAHLRKLDVRRSRLTAARVAAGLTLMELAQKAGIGPSPIVALETGRESPRTRAGWTLAAEAASAQLGYLPEELWPQRAPKPPRLPVAPVPTPEALVIARETYIALLDAVEALPERQRRVIREHFGLDDEERTFREVAEDLGLCRSRVEQIQKQAMHTLRHALKHLDWSPP